MNKINKIIAFLVLILVFSLFNTKHVFSEDTSVTTTPDIAPFSDEIKIVPVKPVVETKVIDTKLDTISTGDVVPLVTSPRSNENLDGAQIIRGEVKSGYNVKVYIDGKYRTTIGVWPDKKGTSGFFYQPIQKLSVGKHNVKFVSYKDGKDYGSSSVVEFNVVEGYQAPDLLTPYYYADDYSTYVIRGYSNTGNKLEVYVDDVKVRVVDSLYGAKQVSYFALAVRNLKVGDHKAYVLSYSKDGKVSKSKLVYFKVLDKGSTPAIVQEVKKDEPKKAEPTKDTIKKDDKNKTESNIKTDTKKEVKKPVENTKKSDVKKEVKQNEKQDKSILIGIVLLVIAIGLIIFWLVSENKDKVKKFIDNLFEEDGDEKKDK